MIEYEKETTDVPRTKRRGGKPVIRPEVRSELIKVAVLLGFLALFAHAGSGPVSADPGTVGFRLVNEVDGSRSFPTGGAHGRPLRIYLWYPASETDDAPLTVRDYVRMAADDFSPSPDAVAGGRESIPLPPQLAQGLSEDELAELMERATAAVPDAFPRTGPFPLLILGQGLYYESPLTHFSLCEYLAGHGYVVATCPLLGTHGRLVSIDAADLETEVRDLEYVLGRARSLPQVDSDRLGGI